MYLLGGGQRNFSRWEKTVKTNTSVCGPESRLWKNMSKLWLKEMKSQQFFLTSTVQSLLQILIKHLFYFFKKKL